MTLKIDLGEDKNYLAADPAANAKKQLSSSLIMDELARSPEAAISEAREAAWPNWINSEPLLTSFVDDDGNSYLFYISDALKNKAIVVHFWDYTVLNSLRSLRYVKEWHRRYHSAGLMTIGVHSPLFEFAKDKKLVLDAVHDLDINYPVVLDSDYSIWKSMEGRFWPRQILIDPKGTFIHDTLGEGNYEEVEKGIQKVLRTLNPGLACPPILKQLYPLDHKGLEIFYGKKRKTVFGNGDFEKGENDSFLFKDDGSLSYIPGMTYLEGLWSHSKESIHPTSNENLKVPYKGEFKVRFKTSTKNFYVVARTKARNSGDVPQSAKMVVELNGKPVFEEHLGADVHLSDARNTQVIVREPRLYHLIKDLDSGFHDILLTLDVENSDAVELFAVYFEDA
jgi:hypothetical protein